MIQYPLNKREGKRKNGIKQRKHEKNPLAHRICCPVISGCTEPQYRYQHSKSFFRFPVPIYHRIRNCLHPECPDEIH